MTIYHNPRLSRPHRRKVPRKCYESDTIVLPECCQTVFIVLEKCTQSTHFYERCLEKSTNMHSFGLTQLLCSLFDYVDKGWLTFGILEHVWTSFEQFD